MTKLKYSIVLVTYNQFDTLRDNFYSLKIIHRYRQDFEVIICDDGSRDTIQVFGDALQDRFKYIRYLWNEHKGFGCAKMKNLGIKKAKGKWILILDGDALLSEDILDEYDKVDLDENTVYMGGKKTLNGKFVPRTSSHTYDQFNGSNVLLPRKNVSQWAPGDKFYTYGFDDYWFAMHWLAKGGKLQAVDNAYIYSTQENKYHDPIPEDKINMMAREERKILPADKWVFN